MQRVWQIAAGEAGRKYADLFLAHDVMFCGPGRFGAYSDAAYIDLHSRGLISTGKLSQVKQFATTVQSGDLVLLRSGYRVEAIGVVHDDGYQHSTIFDDVFGWDSEHTCRVLWQHDLSTELAQIQAERPLFNLRKQIPAFTAVEDDIILAPIRHLFDRCQSRALRPLPPSPPPALSLDELSEALFRRGLGFTAVDQLRRSLEKQRRLIEWYQSSGMKERPTEHEVVAHIILPLLMALGWPEQLLAVEWPKIDLAIFDGTPTDQRRCRLVCEAKGMGYGLQDVLQQAVRYTETLKLAACDKILLADGGRFYLYRRWAEGWEQQPSGYLNVLRIREDHLLPSGTNAIDTIIALTPMGIGS
jgi:hypothetical protein